MHERSLLSSLMKKLDGIARQHPQSRIVGVKVRLGALSHLSAGHFREHFEEAARGSVAERARLDVVEDTDPDDPHAQDILLDSVELEEPA